MKKFNNRGFLLVETLIVATFCLTVLVILFLQFKNLIISYNNSYNYNTVEGVYNLNTIKRYLVQNNITFPNGKTIITEEVNGKTVCKASYNIALTNNYCDQLVSAGGFKTIIHVNTAGLNTSQINTLQNSLESDATLDEGLKNFISQLNSDSSKTHKLIAEFKNDTYASITY